MKSLGMLIVLSMIFFGCKKQSSITENTAGFSGKVFFNNFSANALGSAGIAGESWADLRDNFVDDNLMLKGLNASDNYAAVQTTADIVLSGFQNNGANTVRIPINVPTVTGTWWGAYNGTIDKALSKGMKVIICCWDSKTHKNGQIDDLTQFYNMWNIVINKYGSNSNVYYEIFNEPGYSPSAWMNIAATWLTTYPYIPRNHILISGTPGGSEDVTLVGADSRFNSCLLAVHFYRFFYDKDSTVKRTVPQWEALLKSKIGSYASRTVMTEFGENMGVRLSFPFSSAPNGSQFVSAIQAITNVLHNNNMSSVYWSGYGQGEYDLNIMSGNMLTPQSIPGLAEVRYGWGATAPVPTFDPAAYYKIVNVNSGYVLDVSQGSLLNSAPLIQYPYNSGNNQQWKIIAVSNQCFKFVNRNSGKVIDVAGSSQTAGAGIIQYNDYGGDNQQWQITDQGNGTYEISNRNSSQALDVNQGSLNSGAGIIQYPWYSSRPDQKWQIIKL